MHPGIWTRVSRRATNNNNQNIGKKTTDDRRNSLYRLTHSIICRFYSSKIFVTNAQNDDLFNFWDDTLYHSLEVWKKYQFESYETLVTILLLSCIEEWIVFAGSLMGQFALAFKISRMPTHDFRMNCHELCTWKGSLFMNIYILVNQSIYGLRL